MPLRSEPCRSAVRYIASLAVGVAVFVPAAASEPWPSEVEATYKIAFNGFDVGRFTFRATVAGSSYTVNGDARLSALLGAFRWQGATRSSGQLAGSDPRPAGYTFDFEGTSKKGSIKLGFANGKVTSVTNHPVAPPEPDVVPVRAQHLSGVFDPLSAVLVLSRTTGSNPCGRRLPVFDGKQRFDLTFTYLRQEAVAETRPSGQPGVAIVCRVRYEPIAGHRETAEARQLATTSGIEVALRPVPSAGLYVPYRITIPTMAGSATLVAERVSIATRNEQIAFTH